MGVVSSNISAGFGVQVLGVQGSGFGVQGGWGPGEIKFLSSVFPASYKFSSSEPQTKHTLLKSRERMTDCLLFGEERLDKAQYPLVIHVPQIQAPLL